jgi:hypothetical protein
VIRKLIPIGLFVLTACGGATVSTDKSTRGQQQAATIALSQIDLREIGHVAPKGRVQDSDYNQLTVVENLITHGNEAVPFLIDKLSDETKLENQVFDYWHEVRVGDVALVILADFFTDPTGQTTIPGVGYDTFLRRKPHSNLTAEQLLRNYIAKNTRNDIVERWRAIWAKYKQRVYWDKIDRCFKLSDR